ncbi:hypothetical protein SNE40_011202 [Patella caerulea]|uniref:Uncharacterized protein n=1 Tax=Patella caerulea TaxID=87958 RepID=A0AAN8JL13_PATCE
MESSTPSPTVIDQEYPRLEMPEHCCEAVNLKSSLSSEQTFVIFHDYFGPVKIEEISGNLNKDCQTNIAKSCSDMSRDTSTQTEEDETYATKFCDCSTKHQSVAVRTFVNVGSQC